MANVIALPPRIKVFTLASPLSVNEQREIYEAVSELKGKYPNVPGIDAVWDFNTERGIFGLNLPLNVLVNKVMSKKGERTPTFYEAMQLDRDNLLTNGGYSDYGGVIYNEEQPNADLAKGLIISAKERGWSFPILVHPASLDFDKKGQYKFAEDTSLVIEGDEAEEELKSFDYTANSGFRRLLRDDGGDWNAGWYYPLNSYRYGRVDWKCAEGTRKTLEAEARKELEAAAQKRVQKVVRDLEAKKAKALALLEEK